MAYQFMTRRYLNSQLVEIDGICFEIKPVEQLEYSGDWESAGFDVFVGQRKLKNFLGYPIKKDILKAFKELNK